MPRSYFESTEAKLLRVVLPVRWEYEGAMRVKYLWRSSSGDAILGKGWLRFNVTKCESTKLMGISHEWMRRGECPHWLRTLPRPTVWSLGRHQLMLKLMA